MRLKRFSGFLTSLLLIAGCSGAEYAEGGGEADDEASNASDVAALEALADYYETHYNMHHASMVAETFDAEDGGAMWADGTIASGHDAILASLEANMAGSPVLDLTSDDYMVFGDIAVGHGRYSVETTPPEMETMTVSGAWMAYYHRQADDSWKLGWVTTNYDHPWPEGAMAGPQPSEPPADEGTMTAVIADWVTHYNMGHPNVVAGYHTEDGFAAFSEGPRVMGREGVEAALAERMELAPADIEIHDVETLQLAEGWALDGGWYQLNAKDGGDMVRAGGYVSLVRQAEDGNWQLHWVVTNGYPADAAEGQ